MLADGAYEITEEQTIISSVAVHRVTVNCRIMGSVFCYVLEYIKNCYQCVDNGRLIEIILRCNIVALRKIGKKR